MNGLARALTRAIRPGLPAAALAASAAMLLAACTGGTTSGLAAEPGAVARPGPSASLVQQVRAAGQLGNELDVQPLRDPQVEDLRAAATRAEARGDWREAQDAIAKALLVTPEDPDLLQWQAELALARRDFAVAERTAQLSFDKGPKLGGLCRRNWTTIRIAAEVRGDAARVGEAERQVASCAVPPPVRM